MKHLIKWVVGVMLVLVCSLEGVYANTDLITDTLQVNQEGFYLLSDTSDSGEYTYQRVGDVLTSSQDLEKGTEVVVWYKAKFRNTPKSQRVRLSKAILADVGDEVSKVDDSKVDDSKVDDSKVDDSKVDDSKVDDSKVVDSVLVTKVMGEFAWSIYDTEKGQWVRGRVDPGSVEEWSAEPAYGDWVDLPIGTVLPVSWGVLEGMQLRVYHRVGDTITEQDVIVKSKPDFFKEQEKDKTKMTVEVQGYLREKTKLLIGIDLLDDTLVSCDITNDITKEVRRYSKSINGKTHVSFSWLIGGKGRHTVRFYTAKNKIYSKVVILGGLGVDTGKLSLTVSPLTDTNELVIKSVNATSIKVGAFSYKNKPVVRYKVPEVGEYTITAKNEKGEKLIKTVTIKELNSTLSSRANVDALTLKAEDRYLYWGDGSDDTPRTGVLSGLDSTESNGARVSLGVILVCVILVVFVRHSKR